MVRWADIRPGVLQRMAGRGLVLLGATDAARIYPDLFPTPDAARMAIQRESEKADFPNIPLGSISIGGCSGNRLVPVSYRPAGRGQQTRRALVLENRLEGLADWLTERLGAVVRVEVAPDPEPPPRPARPASAAGRRRDPQTTNHTTGASRLGPAAAGRCRRLERAGSPRRGGRWRARPARRSFRRVFKNPTCPCRQRVSGRPAARHGGAIQAPC